MSTIVNPAWKSMKEGTIVKFKGEDYEIGSNAFGSIEAAVTAGETSDLVIVDKKLTSPVKKENITGAATDIFTSTVKETESTDGKTYTKNVKFTAAAGGTASFKTDDATLVGFEKITATQAGGSFLGGKQDISSNIKTVTDMDKGLETVENTATITSAATGSLSVTGKAGEIPSASVGVIADSEGNTDEAISIVKDTFKAATNDDYEDKTGASYATVTLKLAEISTAINGGSYTEKATFKTSDTNGEKKNEEYVYSYAGKVGAGAATLTDTNADELSGFKTVKITASTAPVTVGELNSRNTTTDDSLKTAFVADQSYTYNFSKKDTEANGGTATITGKAGKEVGIDGEINGFSSLNLKYATVAEEINSKVESEKQTIDFSVKNQKDAAMLTASSNIEESDSADGSLTAANSVLNNIDGVKTVTISNSEINGTINATNEKSKTTKKETGVAVAGITDSASDYADNFVSTVDIVDDALVDVEQAYTYDFAKKTEYSAGGTSFKISGKAAADSDIYVAGYKTVALDNTDATNTLTATLINSSLVTDSQTKIAFTPESSYTETNKLTNSDKAFGDATVKGKTVLASADGFASVKVTGTIGKTFVNGVAGQDTVSNTNSRSFTVKAGKENPVGSYTSSSTNSRKAASTLDVSKATLSSGFSDLKTVKLQGVVGNGNFFGSVEGDAKSSEKIDWKAEEISGAEIIPGSVVDERVTAWTESSDSKNSAAGTLTLKNTSEIFSLTANNFKSVDVAGAIDKTTLNGVAGQTTETDKESLSVTISATKGSYSESDAESTQAATALTVTKATVSGAFTDLKTVKLTDVKSAAPVVFAAAVDEDSKESKKFDWNAEAATLSDVLATLGGEINNESIISYSDSEEEKKSAAGTFTLKNNSADAVISASANDFKSVDVTGAINAGVFNTTLTGVDGRDTKNYKDATTLSVSSTKGTYSYTSSSSYKAVTTLTATKAAVSGDFDDLKSVTLKDVKVTAPTVFTASLDSDSKSSLKYDWNAEAVPFAELTGPYDENITSWTETSEFKDSVVGSFTLANSNAAATIDDTLSIDNFKTVDISGVTAVTAASLWNGGDRSSKYSLKRTASETKRTQEVSNSSTATSVGSLKLTGKSAAPATLTIGAGSIGYSSITLKDANIVTTAAATADSYAETRSYTAKETATLDSGSVVSVDLKVTATNNRKGNGSFTASGSDAFVAFNGSLNGYSSISLKDKVSIGDVNNYKFDGNSGDTYYVPWNGEYFDFIAVEDGAEPAPGDAEILSGNISGSYSQDKNGQITSKWTGSYATTAAGSFTQSASVVNVTAGSILGYDKVTLTGVKTAGNIIGANSESSTVLNYKYAKDEEVANSKVVTSSTTSASSVKVEGKSFSGSVLQVASVGAITGYKSVSLKDASVAGPISAQNVKAVTTTDLVNSPDVIVQAVDSAAVGSLAATDSELNSPVSGFAKVELKNTAAAGTNFIGGDSSTVRTFDTGMTPIETTYEEQAAVGSFSAVSDKKQVAPGDPKLSVVQAVGNVSGFAKVELKNYNAGNVSVGFAANNFGGKALATSIEVIAADEDKETPKTWKKAAATKGNSFTASADNYVDAGAIVRNPITVGAVTGYGKVEATGLTSIGSIENAFVTDSITGAEFAGRIYGAKHYGDWTATAKEEEGKYTAISATASGSAKVKGLVAKNSAGLITDVAPTAVTGNVLGYSTVQLDNVTLGSGAAVTYAGGKYAYSTKINSDEQVIATSTNTADGSIKISNATYIASTTFALEGFKSVNVDLTGDAVITSIIGGTESAQFTDGALDFTTYKCVDKAVVATDGGSVTGKVAGFVNVEFTDTNFGSASEIQGYEIGTKKLAGGEIVQTYSAKTAIVFDDADEIGETSNIEGAITNARSITFKSSTADATLDFNVTGTITSLYDESTGLFSDDLTIEIDKCQTQMDLSKFALDDGDEIKLTSSSIVAPETTATITLGGDYSDLDAYFANMAGASFTGKGEIVFTGKTEDDVKTALENNEISYADTITFKAV